VTARPIRVGIADDSPAIVDLLGALVGQAPGMVLCGVARDGVEAVELVRLGVPGQLHRATGWRRWSWPGTPSRTCW